MRKSVFVHVGAPAARATCLRQQLAANEAALSGAGIAVVVPSRPEDRSPERLAAGVLAADHPTVVVSDDRLAGAPADEVTQLLGALAGHDVHMIYGAPDLGTAIVAEWQRYVMSTAQPVSLATWVEELASGEHPSFWQAYGFSDVFGRWTVPPGQAHVVVAPRGPDAASELLARFGSVIGLPRSVADGVPPNHDVLGLDALELLRRVHAGSGGETVAGAGELVRRVIDDRPGAGSDPTHPVLLPPRRRSWIHRESSLQRKYLEGVGFEIVGDLSDLEVGHERFGDDGSPVDDEAVLTLGVETGAALVERLITSRERRGAARRASVPASVPGLVGRARREASRVPASARAQARRVRLRVVERGRRTYYLHIGAPKCGSSYIQSLLWRNRDALMRDGVYVPGRSQTDHFHAGTDFRGQPYVTQAPDGPWRGAWDRLIDDAERSGYRKIVISSEFLASASPEEIAPRIARLAGADVQVVYAVREFAGLLGSVWQQTVRTAPAAPWPEWLDRLAQKSGADWVWTRHNIGRVLDGWRVGGVDQLHVLVLPRPGGTPGELWRRFGSIVDWRARTTIAAPRENESLGYAQAEVLRRLQERLVAVEPREHRARVTKNLIGDRTLSPMKRVDRLVIPDRLRPWVEAESERQRDSITGSSAHVVGDLDDLRIDDSRFAPDPGGPSSEVMLDAAVAVIARIAATIVREAAAGSAEAP